MELRAYDPHRLNGTPLKPSSKAVSGSLTIHVDAVGFEADRHDHVAAGAAFDELALTPGALARTAAAIRTHGYAEIPMAASTRHFFDAELQKPSRCSSRVDMQVHDLRDTPYASKITTSARQILTALEGSEPTIEPQEIEIRHRPDATSWHTDKAPKALVMLAAARGAGTEFVDCARVDALFQKAEVGITPRYRAVLEPHIRQADPNAIIVFAGEGIADKSIPRLVHRSPPDGDLGRAIFLARWRKGRPLPPELSVEPSPAYPPIHNVGSV